MKINLIHELKDTKMTLEEKLYSYFIHFNYLTGEWNAIDRSEIGIYMTYNNKLKSRIVAHSYKELMSMIETTEFAQTSFFAK